MIEDIEDDEIQGPEPQELKSKLELAKACPSGKTPPLAPDACAPSLSLRKLAMIEDIEDDEIQGPERQNSLRN
jgi:hypothetical protein